MLLRALSLSKGRSTTSEQMVADLKRDPHTLSSVLKKENLKFDPLWPLRKKTTYTSKKFEINLFWTAMWIIINPISNDKTCADPVYSLSHRVNLEFGL